MDVYQDFYSYNGGVYQHETGTFAGGKVMLAIGWGNEGGIDYWLVANTWGSHWGDGGYFKIAVDDVSIRNMVYYYSGITVSDSATAP
jgi:hypothetical protein